MIRSALATAVLPLVLALPLSTDGCESNSSGGGRDRGPVNANCKKQPKTSKWPNKGEVTGKESGRYGSLCKRTYLVYLWIGVKNPREIAIKVDKATYDKVRNGCTWDGDGCKGRR